MIVFRKGKMWKVEGSSAKFRTEEEARKFLESRAHVKTRQRMAVEDSRPLAETVEEAKELIEKTSNQDTSNWSPLEKLRGEKIAICDECECNPCECEKEWKSVEETSSTTESLKEDLS
jgi:hypothetical protein